LAEFRAGHVSGTRFFDIEHFSAPDTDLPHMAPSAGRFSRLAGEQGIGNDTGWWSTTKRVCSPPLAHGGCSTFSVMIG
jgi:hypothetical protein